MGLFSKSSNRPNIRTAGYICSSTGAYGYCWGEENAAEKARKFCVQSGGKTPYEVFASDEKGYGAIAVGDRAGGGNVIGISAGYDNEEAAKERAISECKNHGGFNIHIRDSWNDR